MQKGVTGFVRGKVVCAEGCSERALFFVGYAQVLLDMTVVSLRSTAMFEYPVLSMLLKVFRLVSVAAYWE